MCTNPNPLPGDEGASGSEMRFVVVASQQNSSCEAPDPHLQCSCA